MDEKSLLRKRYKEKRKALGAKRKADLDASIMSQVMEYCRAHRRFQHFHIFLPISKMSEIDTFPVVKALLAEGKRVYTSVTDHVAGGMTTVEIFSDTQYINDQWGIPVPIEAKKVDEIRIDVVFVPLLVCDLKGNRIGYGKGFYDRFLAGLSPEVFKVGLSYFVPEVSISAEAHDIPLDICILPSGIIEFN
ncbi:5-formyltetrahydrofolate cyclo-ligase [Echinicola strongylocentroti]|uniref:5-formyltetrahydrofolate cyclo-ligase n=1 Tax=Echinicola strongylocentroti TaxID=1795355 RepID=A0A2Z4IIV2_9BACT|nr:5-formyltetrahydrofolate cyclo-ligase [Echinicola strongylocentroti]AWW31061.1 5-formyltetrahydrofolate cyclo-ligase [Echinicola strongylocentroti]